MTRRQAGKLVMTLVLILQAVLGFVLDWSGNHLLNPEWHPHARFHGALLLFLLTGASGTALWLLWRKSKEPGVAIKAAGAVSLSFWTPFFYVPLVLPQSTPWAGRADAVPHLAGQVFYPNVAVAAAFVALTAGAFWLTLARSTR